MQLNFILKIYYNISKQKVSYRKTPMNLLKPIIISAITIFILAWGLPTVSYGDWVALLFAAAVLTLLQRLAKPVLNILFLPINIVTLGLFSVVINVGLLWLATYLVPSFQIQPMMLVGIEFNQFFSLLIISFMISLLQRLISFFL